MKTLVLSLIAILSLSAGFAQITVTDIGSSVDLNGTTYYVSGSPSDFDIEHGFDVNNVSDIDLQVGARRTEIDVVIADGVKNTLCWRICPPYVDQGTQTVFVSPFAEDILAGETNSTFVGHMRPNGVDGCSLYRFEWFNANNDSEVYATVDMMFDHSDNSACTVGIDEFENISTSIAPNPANNYATLSIDGVDRQVNIQVMDLLGQTVSADTFNPSEGANYELSTTELKNGIYFVSIIGEGEILKTIKLVVKH